MDIDDIDNSYHNDITPDDFTKVETVYNELIDKIIGCPPKNPTFLCKISLLVLLPRQI